MSVIAVRELNLFYGNKQALYDINLDVEPNSITALIGPSGCGKSTFLRTLNRMNDSVANTKITGSVKVFDEDIYSSGVEVERLRKNIGMVFQHPNPFPKSIYDNITYGPKLHGLTDRYKLDEIVENSLRASALWDEVKDVLKNLRQVFQVGSSSVCALHALWLCSRKFC